MTQFTPINKRARLRNMPPVKLKVNIPEGARIDLYLGNNVLVGTVFCTKPGSYVIDEFTVLDPPDYVRYIKLYDTPRQYKDITYDRWATPGFRITYNMK